MGEVPVHNFSTERSFQRKERLNRLAIENELTFSCFFLKINQNALGVVPRFHCYTMIKK